MHKLLLIASFVLVSIAASAQRSTYSGFPSLVWPKLYDITFVESEDDLGTFEKPVFSTAVKAIEGKQVVLPGYMVPLENVKVSKQILLSSLPLNACFFCGVGGPEPAAEINLRTETAWTDKPIEVRGTLRLNDSDPDRLYYILEDAEILGPVR